MRINDRLFTYELPTRIVYGTGAVVRTGEEVAALGATKVLITTDGGVQKAGLLQPVIGSLERAGIKSVVFDKVVADSGVDIVEEATKLAKDNNCDLILGIGGGSSM